MLCREKDFQEMLQGRRISVMQKQQQNSEAEDFVCYIQSGAAAF